MSSFGIGASPPRGCPVDDAALLRALLGSPGLTTGEREAFAGMQARLGRWSALTERQRIWAQGVGARLGLAGVQAPAQSLGKAPGRQAWDPGKGTRRMSGGKLEVYVEKLSAELRELERARKRRKAAAT